MAKVTGILCQIVTGIVSGASTDGYVRLGLGGREFRLDSKADDYEPGSIREYIMGQGPVEPLPPPQIRVNDPDMNDPRVGYPIDTVDLAPRTPVYIRFETELDKKDDNWNLKFAGVLVFSGQFVVGYTPPVDFNNMWMGFRAGKILYLTTEIRARGQTILEYGRKLAGKPAKSGSKRK